MKTILLATILAMLISTVAFSSVPMSILPSDSNPVWNPSSGTYHFIYYSGGVLGHYCGLSVEVWAGINFDPADADPTCTDNYEITYVDANFHSSAQLVDLYIAADSAGMPDMGDIRYQESDIPTGGPIEHQIDPPAAFGAGETCWIWFALSPSQDYLGVDDDGNSGHSWCSFDSGASWDWSWPGDIQFDWMIEAYGEPSSPVEPTSLGSVKAIFK